MRTLLGGSLFCLLLLVIPCSATPYIVPNSQKLTCYDYSTNYHVEHLDWGRVTISNNPYFRGISHMVNYLVIDNETLKIHDGLYNADYVYSGWNDDGLYYHFWFNGSSPWRNYKFLYDNREELNTTGERI